MCFDVFLPLKGLAGTQSRELPAETGGAVGKQNLPLGLWEETLSSLCRQGEEAPG